MSEGWTIRSMADSEDRKVEHLWLSDRSDEAWLAVLPALPEARPAVPLSEPQARPFTSGYVSEFEYPQS